MDSETKSRIILSLKENKLVRTICYPYIYNKKENLKNNFGKTHYAERLRTFKNTHKGERCFIIGNGPSLATDDLNRLSGEYTFAANRIISLFDKTEWRPTFYVCQDLEVCNIIIDELYKYNDIPKFLNIEFKKNVKADMDNLYYFFAYTKFRINRYDPENHEFCSDISKYVSSGYTVTYASIQLAAYMGFNEIYLLGVDHSYALQRVSGEKQIKKKDVKSYADGIPDWGASVQPVDVTTKAYIKAKEYADSHGIKIRNATRGGKLEVFERIEFDSLFS